MWKIDIWPRHSYLTPAFVPGQSDLDLSAYIPNQDTPTSYLRFYRAFRFVFRIVGELNIYNSQSIAFIRQQHFNGFELERDPLLLQKFNIVLKAESFTKEKAASYLLMALLSDIHKIRKCASARLKKWNYHFEHVNSSLAKAGKLFKPVQLKESAVVFSVLTAVANLSDCSSAEEALQLRTRLKFYLELIPEFITDSDREEWVEAAAAQEPEIWLYFIEFICQMQNNVSLPKLEKDRIAVMQSQMDWVILRLLKQSHGPKDKSHSIERLLFIKKVLRLFTEKNPACDFTDTFLQIDGCVKILKG